ncbi:MAG: GAF domain-containing protein [Anaerolineae bacterium]|nr:GAF domain-containing protein [Anaerolineae bacterium]
MIRDEAQELDRRRRQVMSAGLLLLVLVLLAMTVLVAIGVWQGAWQLFGAAGLILVGGVFVGRSRRLVHTGHVEAAANLQVAALVLLMPFFMAFLSGAVWAFALVALMVTGLLTGLVWPRHRMWRGWGLGALSAVGVFLLDGAFVRFGVWARFDLAGNVFLAVFVYTVFVFLVLTLLVQVIRMYQDVTRIRDRLVFVFIIIVLVVVGAVSTTSVLVGSRDAQERTFSQLESVVALKASAVDTWVQDLQLELDILLTEAYEVTRVRTVLLWDPLSNPQDAQVTLRRRLQNVIDRSQRFEELFIIDLEGKVVLSTDVAQEGKIYNYEAYFQRGLQERYVQPPRYYPSLGKTAVIAVRPLVDLYGDVLGVLAGRASIKQLNEMMIERAGLGVTGETYLVGVNHALLTESLFGQEYAYVRSVGIDRAVQDRSEGRAKYTNYHDVPVLGVFRWLPELELGLLAEVDRAEVAAGARATVLVNVGVGISALILAVAASYLFARDITIPIVDLATTAAQIAAGKYELAVRVRREDEMGTLARAFNSMTVQLRDLIGSLERRVAERTRGLEAAAEVSRVTTSELDIERLLPRVVDLVQERFGLYYVGLFVVDEDEEFAVLRAGTGEAGRTMLSQGWRLPIGGESMIGQCMATGQPGVKQTGGDQSVRFDNPLLPQTRSELALPLRYGRRVIGAMTVQSARESAFEEADITILQNMADQVAVAVENAHLFAETQASLARAEQLQRRYQGQVWAGYLRARTISGYERIRSKMTPLGGEPLRELEQLTQAYADGGTPAGGALSRAVVEGTKLVVPIVQAGRVVGALGFEGREWSAEEVALVEALSEQLAQAAENQRLIEETQERAARERLTRETIDRIRGADDMSSIMQLAAQALGQQLNASEVVIRLGTESKLTVAESRGK